MRWSSGLRGARQRAIVSAMCESGAGVHGDEIVRTDEHTDGMRLDVILLRIVRGGVENHEVVTIPSGFSFILDLAGG